jgi:flagellar hook-associated protein 3 FlgL
MTILSTSAFYERANLNMTNLRKQAEDLQAQISSGSRINKASDDPVAAARLRELARADSLAKVNVANANRAMSDLTLADSALEEMAGNLIRVQELATQAATGTLSNSQRAAIGEQIANIRSNMIALANSKDSAGHALFGGESAGAAYAIDGSGNPYYDGTPNSDELPLGDGQTVVRGVTGPEFLNFDLAGSPTDLFAVLGNLATALQGGSPDPAGAANTALSALSTGLEKINTTQTIIGSRMNWVDLNVARNERQGELRTDETAAKGGIDEATAITQMQQIMTVLEASQASFVKLSSMSLFDAIR